MNPLADIIFEQAASESVETLAMDYVSEEKEIATPEDAISGAKDIIAEIISDNADYRIYIRNITMQEGLLISNAKDEKKNLFMKCITNFRKNSTR